MTAIPLVDLKTQYFSIQKEIDDAIREVVHSQAFRLGPAVRVCEEKMASYVGTRFACGVSSGTDALMMALMAENIGAGHEVITTSSTFFATAGAIARIGATPVFVDVDPETYNIDPAKIASKITSKTKAIIPVHLFGQCADMDRILSIAEKYNLCVIEDACQAIGATYRSKRAGSMGHYGCFSFFPSKNLGAFGDGGMVLTQDEKRYARLKRLREHGADEEYQHEEIGGNFRLDTIQAAVVVAKMNHIESWNQKRRENAKSYDAMLAQSGLVTHGDVLPPVVKEPGHVFHHYVIRAKKRDALADHLKKNGIACGVYYPIPLHLQKCFAYLNYHRGDLPESERVSLETLSIPVYPELSKAQQQGIVDTIRTFYTAR